MEKTLLELRRKRGVVKASLTRVRKFVELFDPEIEAMSLLEFRQEELPRLNKKFDEVQCEIELISPEETEVEEGERDKFERDYFAIRSQVQEIINSTKSSSAAGLNASFNPNFSGHRAKLAPISLPNFDGKIEEWESFYNGFSAMVHGDESITEIQKFYYLRSCVRDTALDLIKSLPMTDANYEVAIQRLKKRYDNRSLIIQSHIRALLDSPVVDVASARQLQGLYSHVCTHIAALKALGQPVQHWDAWLVTIVLSRLDKATAHEWQLRQDNTEMPKFDKLDNFLSSRCTAYESSEAWFSKRDELKQGSNWSKRSIQGTGTKKVSLASMDATQDKCECCNELHKLYMCQRFREMSPTNRLQLVREAKLCFNCLSPFHMSHKCKSRLSCQRCKRRHNSLLHLENQKETEEIRANTSDSRQDGVANVESSSGSSRPLSLAVSRSQGHVFLSTAIVLVTDKNGYTRQCRAVLDSGSQVNFISKTLLNKLQLSCKKTELPVCGIGSSQILSSAVVDIHVTSRVKQFKIKLSCHVLPVIVNELQPCVKPMEDWKIPSQFIEDLADPGFFRSTAIDLLIGGGTFYDLLESERVQLSKDSLCLQSTKFGWLVTGEVKKSCLFSLGSIGEGLQEDWIASQRNEDALYGRHSKSNKKSSDAQRAVEHFKLTAKRNSEGRFVLRLPVKEEVSDLGDTFNIAKSRFFNVERKLQRNESLKMEYVKFMDEYLKMGHMQKVISNEIPKRSFYLPHHAIVKDTSLTTKVRVVFDASAKSSSGLSLNDVLFCGPSIQEDIFSILCRFRKHIYVITADVEKMYRQVYVAEEDSDLQRIVWRASPTEELLSYRLSTVTYGTGPASYMATQCLVSLAEEFKDTYPKAAKAIQCDFYMDDLMTGCDTEKECFQLQQEVSSILNSAKLPLRKWCSNSPSILRCISKDEPDPLFILDISDDDSIKSLGLGWKPFADNFLFNIISSPEISKLTKRVLLSQQNRIFDPLGFLTPVLIKGKIFLKQLWQLKIDWDTPLQDDLKSRWYRYYTELEEIKNLAIPRRCLFSVTNQFQLVGFCDASMEAYGACIYVRSLGRDEKWHAQLLCSKTRVAPVKGITIPRLELNGALLLVHLAIKVAESWNVKIQDFSFWTDSMIVLNWLNSQGCQLKTYVQNRVSEILELTEADQWHHVRTNENPADVITRGINAMELLNAETWWNGPVWLSQSEDQWNPLVIQSIPDHELPEQRPVRLVLIGVDKFNDLVEKYSNWHRLMRATAWMLKFIEYLRSKKNPVDRFLTYQDLKNAERVLVRRTQSDAFHEELNALHASNQVPNHSKLRRLFPILREDKVIVVGGRLENAQITEAQKHPIVLPAKHKITRLIFEDCHRALLHCGPQALLAHIRQKYWPLKGRVIARSVTTRCITCIRAKPKFECPLMGVLPRQRVQSSRPFLVTGVDFAGPIVIRSGIRRVSGKKAWIAVFVCFSTRAIHLEAVEDLTSGAFIAALRRFMARRGKCTKIYSDNGTNFIGAQRELATYISRIDSKLANEGIEWHFNPPSAPHFGGLWESAVKSMKHHLNRVMKETKLTLAELGTLLCQIEACVNSRPLTPMSHDPSDLEPLTPAHFLVGGPITLHPEPDVSNENINGLKRWKLVQRLMQSFWNRWHKEYLPQLQVRGKWTNKTKDLIAGDIVIIKDDCVPPTKWKLGRIKKVHPGKDNVTRVVTVHTSSGSEMRRPTVKLCRLPVYDEEDEVGN